MLIYDCSRGNQSYLWLDFKPTLWNRLHALDFNFVLKTMEDSTTKFLLNKRIVKMIYICTGRLVQLLALVKEVTFTNEQRSKQQYIKVLRAREVECSTLKETSITPTLRPNGHHQRAARQI